MGRMKARWFIECAPFTDTGNNDASNIQKMILAVKELGCEIHVEKYIPFGGSEYDFFQDEGPVVFYGSLNAAKDMQDRGMKWKPLAWCNWEALRCSSYYAHWGKHLLSDSYSIIPFGDLPRMKDFLFDFFGDSFEEKSKQRYTIDGTKVIFIRPDENNKIFSGHCVSDNNFDRWYKTAGIYEPKPNTLAIIAKPVQILSETRCIIADKKAITGSQYSLDRVFEIGPPVPGAMEFAEKVVNSTEWQPHPIFVMDIAQTEKGFRLLEIGPVNCAGFYGCDAKQIVEAMTNIAERDYDELC
jgi:hypothetical protein